MSAIDDRLRAQPRDLTRDAGSVNTLLRRWCHDRDPRAREQLVAHFTPMAHRLARRYNSPHEPFEDLAQVAVVGLLGAVDRFDLDRGIAFRTFAIPTILGELKRYFRTTGWSVHVPRGIQELSLRVDRAARELSTGGRAPTPPQLAQHLEIGVEDVLVALETSTAHYAVSLDAPARGELEDAVTTVIDRVGQTEEGYALSEAKLSLSTTLDRLPYHERRALHLRVNDDLKQSEIAEIMGCSQMQISRLLRRAAQRVREMTDPVLDDVPIRRG